MIQYIISAVFRPSWQALVQLSVWPGYQAQLVITGPPPSWVKVRQYQRLRHRHVLVQEGFLQGPLRTGLLVFLTVLVREDDGFVNFPRGVQERDARAE